MAIVLTWLVLGLAIGLVVLGIRGLLRWDGVWRWLALVVPLPLLVTGVRIIVDTRADPTSHNLWPFEVLASAVISLILLVVLEIGRAVFARRSRWERRG